MCEDCNFCIIDFENDLEYKCCMGHKMKNCNENCPDYDNEDIQMPEFDIDEEFNTDLEVEDDEG